MRKTKQSKDNKMLQIENLKCCYGKIEAVKGVSLSVEKGELVSLIGANGAGKTTILESICGLLPKSDGKISFCGEDIVKLSTSKIVGKGIGIVPEGRQIFPVLSVKDNLMLGAYSIYKRVGKKSVAAHMDQIYDHFPILRTRREQLAGTLSGGEQQMLAIGRALMARPKMLLLDEPSMGLAPIIVSQIFKILVSLKEQGLTILLVEQNAGAALKISDRGYVLETGKVALKGKASELLNDDGVKRAYLGKDVSINKETNIKEVTRTDSQEQNQEDLMVAS